MGWIITRNNSKRSQLYLSHETPPHFYSLPALFMQGINPA